MSAARDGGRDPPSPEPRTGDEPTASPARQPASSSLKAALRTARVDEAERSRAIADLQGAELARLEILRDALDPVLAQIPKDVDLFDAALMPGPRPRLFIDMIGFVEMAHDKRQYRFIQDTRDGRVVLCESERIDTVAQAVTAYIARRLIVREKALAAIGIAEPFRPARALWPGWLRMAGRLVLEYLGIVALVVLVWVLGDALYHWATAVRR